MEEFRYNSELLIPDESQVEKKRMFNSLLFALEYPRLRETFLRYDEIANRGKSTSRRWAISAVLITTVALVVAAFEPAMHIMLPHDGLWVHVPRASATLASLAGIVAVLISFFGIKYGVRKEEWLVARRVTERIRQWHFQQFLGSLDEIIAGVQSEDLRAAYLKSRDDHFAEFKDEFIDRAALHLGQYLDWGKSDEQRKRTRLSSRIWLRREWRALKVPDITGVEKRDLLDELLIALSKTRIRGQLDYTVHKLRFENQSFWTHPRVQRSVLGGLTIVCVFSLLFSHILVLVGVLASFDWSSSPLIPAITISIALIALAGNTLEEGLMSEREITRLSSYLLEVESVEEEFDEATTVEEKITALRQLEEASFNEMVVFLRTFSDARFLM